MRWVVMAVIGFCVGYLPWAIASYVIALMVGVCIGLGYAWWVVRYRLP